jgi:hypothetical protein
VRVLVAGGGRPRPPPSFLGARSLRDLRDVSERSLRQGLCNRSEKCLLGAGLTSRRLRGPGLLVFAEQVGGVPLLEERLLPGVACLALRLAPLLLARPLATVEGRDGRLVVAPGLDE